MWVPRWLGETYAKLYAAHGLRIFSFEDVLEVAGNPNVAKLAASKLRRCGFLYAHARNNRRREYRLCPPEVFIMLCAGRIKNLSRIPQQRYSRLVGIISVELMNAGAECAVVYGSVARGTASTTSDVDLFTVSGSAGNFSERIDEMVELEDSRPVQDEISFLADRGIQTHISFLPLNRAETARHPPILLDIVDEGIEMFDTGVFEELRIEIKKRMAIYGAKKVPLDDGSWYWDLKPDYRFGEVIEI